MAAYSVEPAPHLLPGRQDARRRSAELKGGVVVHDHFRPYNALAGVDHAFCNAHHLRELKALIEIDKEPWAQAMRDVLVEAACAVRRAKEAGESALEPNV